MYESRFRITVLVTAAMFLAGTGVARADINQDGKADLVWQNVNTGEISAWLLNGPTVTGTQDLTWTCGGACAQVWASHGAFGPQGILWADPTYPGGEVDTSWNLSGATVTGQQIVGSGCTGACAQSSKIIGYGQFSPVSGGVVRHNPSTGQITVDMTVAGGPVNKKSLLSTLPAGAFSPVALGKFGGGWWTDVLLYDPGTGRLLVWMLGATPGSTPPGSLFGPDFTTVASVKQLGWTCDTQSGCAQAWKIIGVEDLDYDGIPDLVWFNASTGQVSAWLLAPPSGNSIPVKGTMNLSWTCSAASGCSTVWKPIAVMPGYLPVRF